MVKPTSLPPRYLAVLRHIGLYRITLKDVIAHRFVSVKADVTDEQRWNNQKSAAGTMLTRLVDDGYLNHHHQQNPDLPPFPKNVPYYTLTRLGAMAAGVSRERSEHVKEKQPEDLDENESDDLKKKSVFRETALQSHLTALWFCMMYRQPRHRLEPTDLAQLFGKKMKFFENVPHCLARTDSGLRIYRVYSASTGLSGILDRLRKVADKVKSISSIRPWAEDHDYAVAVLAPEPAYCTDIKTAVKRDNLSNEMRIHVALGPTPVTLRDALKNHRF